MARAGGLTGRLVEAAERRTGYAVARREELDRMQLQLEESFRDRRLMDLLAYQVLNSAGEVSHDVETKDRLELVRQAREVWRKDPQGGAAVRLLNDFVFGRGVPKPRAKDPELQKVLDEAWDDPQNQRTLTGYEAQRRKGTALALQSNVFLLEFSGDDGRVKLSTLRHDSVKDVVRDPEERARVLFYKTEQVRTKWDYAKGREVRVDPQGKPIEGSAKPEVLYYEHWSNVEEAVAEGVKFERPPQNERGLGAVYQVAVNLDDEMAFGHPEMHRVTRWFSAYNEFMSSRVDLVKAAAAFIMKRKVQGGKSAVERTATKQLARSGELGAARMDPDYQSRYGDLPFQVAPRPGSVINENPAVSHEPFNLNTNSAAAQADGTMLQGQVSAGTGWPGHYFGGDPGSLAGATAVELPVLKLVEARQEVFEGAYRWFIDRVIDRAVETGRLDRSRSPTQLAEARAARGWRWAIGDGFELRQFPPEAFDGAGALREDLPTQAQDESDTQRDLSYEFAFPNPLRRMMGELVTAITQIAQTFDPNGTNLELSKTLLAVALGEGLEMQDPAGVVEAIFPPGYEDPALAAVRAQQQPPPPGDGTPGADGEQHAEDNPYGARRKSQPPEDAMEAEVEEARRTRVPEGVRRDTRDGMRELEELFDRDVRAVVERELLELARATGEANGNGSHNGR